MDSTRGSRNTVNGEWASRRITGSGRPQRSNYGGRASRGGGEPGRVPSALLRRGVRAPSSPGPGADGRPAPRRARDLRLVGRGAHAAGRRLLALELCGHPGELPPLPHERGADALRADPQPRPPGPAAVHRPRPARRRGGHLERRRRPSGRAVAGARSAIRGPGRSGPLPGPRADGGDVAREFRSLRVTKSNEELEWLRRGAAYTDAAHEALEHKARPGMREYELMEVILSAYPCALAEAQVAFLGSTSMREPDRCVPAQFPTSRRVEMGDLFFTELSIAFGGYGGQSLRTFAFGRPSALVGHMHELALELFEAVRRALRPGATSEEILEVGDLAGRHSFSMVDALLHGWGIG